MNFKKFKGLQARRARKEIHREESGLERLLKYFKKKEDEFKAVLERVEEDMGLPYPVQSLRELIPSWVKIYREFEDKVLFPELYNIGYNARDISALVQYFNPQDLDIERAKRIGAYTGSLISVLTERNKKCGKRTVIFIPENHINYLGYLCGKFDIVVIVYNRAKGVFTLAKEGDLLAFLKVEDSESCAAHSAGTGGNVGAIYFGEVRGESDGCAAGAGEFNGRVGVIHFGKVIKSEYCAANAGTGGNVGAIYFGEVRESEGCAAGAGGFNGRVGVIHFGEASGSKGCAWRVGEDCGNIGSICFGEIKDSINCARQAGNTGGNVGFIYAKQVTNSPHFAEDTNAKVIIGEPTEEYKRKVAEVEEKIREAEMQIAKVKREIAQIVTTHASYVPRLGLDSI